MAKRWTAEEEAFLRENYQTMTNKDLAGRFRVSTVAVQRKLSRLTLLRQEQKKWTATEEGFLREQYARLSDQELADRFDVTEIAIKRKLNRLSLRRNLRRRPASRAEAPPPLAGHGRPVPNGWHTSGVPDRSRSSSAAGRESESQPPRDAASTGRRATVKLRPNERRYTPEAEYALGEMIYHDGFRDHGRVTEKITTSGGNHALLIHFSRVGRKTLLEKVPSPPA